MSLFRKFKRKSASDEQVKREGNLPSPPIPPNNAAELRTPSLSTESHAQVKHFASPNRPMNYSLENTTLFEGLNVPGVKASSETDSQDSGDTSRSQHTDVTSELSSVLSVHDKSDDSQINHSGGKEKKSGFSFVRSDSVRSKDGESSDDEGQTHFAFIKEEDNTFIEEDDRNVVSQSSDQKESVRTTTENILASSVVGLNSEEINNGQLNKTPADHNLLVTHVEKDVSAQNSGLQATSFSTTSTTTVDLPLDSVRLKSDVSIYTSSPADLLPIAKVTPTTPATKSAVARKKKRTGKAIRPGQAAHWKHEETPLDEFKLARELHQSASSSLIEKEPLKGIPEDSEEAISFSEDQVLVTPGLTDSNIVIPVIQIEATRDDDLEAVQSLPTIPEIQVTSDDTSNDGSSTENVDGSTVSSEAAAPVSDQNAPAAELKTGSQQTITIQHNSIENDQWSAKGDSHSTSPELLDTSIKLQATDYGIELSQEDRITLLLQTSDSKLNDIQTSYDEVVATSNRCISDNIVAVKMRIEKRKEYQQLREQEVASLAEENYELAEQLGAKMESLLLEVDYKVENASNEVHKFMTDQLRIFEEEKQLRSELVEKLNVFKSDEEYKLENVNKEFTALQMKEKKKLATIEDHINREKGYIGLDKEHVLKAEAAYNSERDERCADYLAKKKLLSEEMSTLQEQIAEVAKQLAVLRQKEALLVTSLAEEDTKVKVIEDEMQGEKQQIDAEWDKIHKRDSELQDDINELEVNRSAYQTTEDEHIGTQQNHQQSIDTLQSWVTTHCDRLKQLDQFNEVLQCCHGKVTVNGRATSPELNQLEEEKRSKDQQVKELTSKVFTVQTKLSQFQKTHSDINNRIPQLNEAKKAAVSSRQYREAGQISQQIKALTQQVENEQEQISVLEAQLSSHTAQLLSLNQQVANMEAKLVTLRKEKDVTMLQNLFLQCRRLTEEAKSFPSLLDFLRSYVKLCRILADEMCIKYSMELSDMKLDDITINDNAETNSGVEDMPLNGDHSPLPSNHNSKDTSSHPGADSNNREEIEFEIAAIESQIDSAVNSDDFELAATLDDKLKSLKETLTHF